MEKNENFKTELENQYTILIKASEQKETKRFAIILTILIITLISVIISIFFASLAYKNSLKINKENKDSFTHYQTLAITYNDTYNLNLENIGNNYQLKNPKTINITNEGDTDITFDIKLTSINTSLLSTNNLFYTLTKNNTESTKKELPLSDKVITSNIKIAPKETVSFILKVAFTGTMEENNYSNYYKAKIIVEQKDNKSELLE